MPSSRLDSHRDSVQNGMLEKLIAFMVTIPVLIFRCYVTAIVCLPDSQKHGCHKNVRAKNLCRITDRHIHSPHGDYFRDRFCVYVSDQLLAQSARSAQSRSALADQG